MTITAIAMKSATSVRPIKVRGEVIAQTLPQDRAHERRFGSPYDAREFAQIQLEISDPCPTCSRRPYLAHQTQDTPRSQRGSVGFSFWPARRRVLVATNVRPRPRPKNPY